MFLTYAMGFKALHGNGDHNNVTFVNYGDVGFGLILDTKLEPLMHIRVWFIPSLGLVSMSDLAISLVSLMVWSWLCAEDGGNTLDNEGKLCFFHASV